MSEPGVMDFQLPDQAFNSIIPREGSEYWCGGLGWFVWHTGFFHVENNVVYYSFTCSRYIEGTDSISTFGLWIPQGGFSE